LRVVVTGGAGFIGSQLGRRLHEQGHEVVLLDNLQYGHLDNMVAAGGLFGRFVCKDVRDPDLGSVFNEGDIVFHLAGIAALPVCQADPRKAYDVNVAGLGNVLEAARRAGVARVVFSSTSAVYERTKAPLLAEHLPIQPDLVYACTKAAAERLCDAYAQNYGLDIIVLRFFNVYGPHQDIHRVSPPFTSYVARELVHGRAPILFNPSNAKRDYVHSSDVIRLLVTLLTADGTHRAERYNVCSGTGYSVPELYEIFADLSGVSEGPRYENPEAFWDRYPGLFQGPHPLPRERVAEEVFKSAIGDPTNTHDAFDWRATVPIRDGIGSVVDDARRRLAVGQ